MLYVAQSTGNGLPNAGDPWSDGMATHVNNDGTTLVVERSTNQYVDVMDRKLKKKFDNVYHIDHPTWMNPVGDASFGIAVIASAASAWAPISNHFPWFILSTPYGIEKDVSPYLQNYKLDLQIKRINWYSTYNIIY